MPDQFQFQDQEGDDQPKRNRWIDRIPWIIAGLMLLLAGAFALKAFSNEKPTKAEAKEPSIVGQPLPEPEVQKPIAVVPSQAEQALMEENEKLKKLLGEREALPTPANELAVGPQVSAAVQRQNRVTMHLRGEVPQQEYKGFSGVQVSWIDWNGMKVPTIQEGTRRAGIQGNTPPKIQKPSGWENAGWERVSGDWMLKK